MILAATRVLGEEANRIVIVEFGDPVDANSFVSAGGVLRDGMMPSPAGIGRPDLPWQQLAVQTRLHPGDIIRLTILEADTIVVPQPIPPKQHDQITSDTATPPPPVPITPDVYGVDTWYPHIQAIVLARGAIDGQSVSEFAWCPFLYNPSSNRLIVIRRARLLFQTDGTDLQASAVVDTIVPLSSGMAELSLRRFNERPHTLPNLSPGMSGAPSWVLPSDDPPLGATYVVITNNVFKAAMYRLVRWKATRGIAAGLATVEAIESSYPATDAAASIREYLKAAYAAGLEWVLLAGDETVVPVRYAYAGYQSNPTDPYQFQICDMYFAELDGDWDADGDGIYGEYFGDAAEMFTELYIGRLPFSDPTEAQTIIDKIIAYERGPDDPAYLTRELSVSADQMRDWADGTGQHRLVENIMPPWWSHDNQSMVESPSGASTAPAAPEGASFPSLLADGFGWVNYFTHGRADGIIVRASGYSEWPKSYVWTFGASGDGHGHLNEITATPYPGIHLSIGCNHGGFDMDTPPFPPGVHESVSERLLFTPKGGAVAFIGQSRWGWVSTSYRIIEEFYKRVADDATPNHLGIYQSLAKSKFPQYRDLNYGNNLHGDPEMPVWKDIPRAWTVKGPVTFAAGETNWSVEVRDAGGPVPGAIATVNIGDSIWAIGPTDGNGAASAMLSLPPATDAVLTVSKPGYRVYVDTVPQSIITGIVDDEDDLPRKFDGLSNYPNPFNPSTTLAFTLDRPSEVRLIVYDILGRPVATLVDGAMIAGPHTISFTATDNRGRPLASGVYLARLATGNHSDVRKIVLMR